MKKSTQQRPVKRRKKPAKQASPAVEPGFQPIVAAFARDRLVSLGKMFTTMGLKVNGKLFAMVKHERLVLKLPEERVAGLVREGGCRYFDRGDGKPLKEWVSIPEGVADWIALARESHRFVGAAR